ncbi:cytochrome c biogenesis protein ResB [Arthrobacter caoxuetaonis]|uniref:Cytochrome c biogenesis protein ResB n=1 Tax=Arthrobacter caoxuetaonis TaxID=2886935 RepID=A0A9X1MCN2_9MICC|nr:cytochrome c biogenesis protein ResB [Arthrobacter caoxuetaonis]MCC3281373.1 cytochrome c biogenesis protein ResB [Arthrobacter caoxuetaonis]MCC3296374.1 cytochrome c biogenesis protein ResB [Arthrobacter caoxuetaonis]USQ58918.1 cytochrome c biogenesis protein ResB [Arthrobacter caoxuetaonis]
MQTPPSGAPSANATTPPAGKPGKKKADDVALPSLGLLGTLRWAWTQLTSMRTALFLLLLLAVAAVPGSLFPQRPANPAAVTQYIQDNPGTGPWLDRFQLFDVYSSIWFSAIYLLLFISLIGCVIPRAKVHWKALRSKPPRTPTKLSRLPEYGTMVVPAGTGLTAGQAARDAAQVLRKRGYRVEARDLDSDRPSVGAERGFAKETGNLVFHVSLIGVLASVAIGGLVGYNGQRVVVEGDTFVNTLVGYDTFSPGTNFSESQLAPYSLTLDDFDVTFDRQANGNVQPLDFTASVTVQEDPDEAPRSETLKVNKPLSIGGTKVYLVGNGYAPVVTVRDGAGDIAFQGPVVGVPTDGVYTSLMVIKAPDAKPDQLGFVGFFLPTAMLDPEGVAFSGDPDPVNPQLNLNSYYGDLGLDNGVPSNVFVLDTDDLTPLNNRDLDAGGIVLGMNQIYDLPEGKGSISFDGLLRYAALDIHYDPAKVGVLIFSVLSLAGLSASLFLARRRVWVRTGTSGDGRIMVEYGLLARGEDPRLEAEAEALRGLLEKKWLAGGPAAAQAEGPGDLADASVAGKAGRTEETGKDS